MLNPHNEKRPSSPDFHKEYAWDRKDNVDGVGDKRDEVRVCYSGMHKEVDSVVEDEVDSGTLLKSLQNHSDHHSAQLVSSAWRTAETVENACFSKTHFIVVTGLDFYQLFDERLVVDF
ncbi:hypothetical protein OGAPHI_000088 [Ogataea philodendri]|uniref:Uncharacterized protein n=1 Tax=Ogataea philodendri TaxID=1378263 RepID=A0A9P8PHI2_9ASCO|nr:uncharacterized protein OGAPHI_000088 [Ogataea philodendri]KAH3671902.1 hypothetical protein OGAPHI_000088 [Ogataea philodendri]